MEEQKRFFFFWLFWHLYFALQNICCSSNKTIRSFYTSCCQAGLMKLMKLFLHDVSSHLLHCGMTGCRRWSHASQCVMCMSDSTAWRLHTAVHGPRSHFTSWWHHSLWGDLNHQPTGCQTASEITDICKLCGWESQACLLFPEHRLVSSTQGAAVLLSLLGWNTKLYLYSQKLNEQRKNMLPINWLIQKSFPWKSAGRNRPAM